MPGAPGPVGFTAVVCRSVGCGASDPGTVAEHLVAAILPGQSATELAGYLATFLGGAHATPRQVKQRTPVAVGLLLAAPISQFR